MGDVGFMPSTELAAARAMKSITVQQTPLLHNWYVTPNWQLVPFDDMRVRQAFSLALDRTALSPEASRAFRQPTIHLVPEEMTGYNPDLTGAAGRKGKNALTPDLDTARKLAGAYAAEKCGGEYCKRPPITFPSAVGSTTFAAIVEAMIEQWRRAFPGWTLQSAEIDGPMELKVFWYVQLGLSGWTQDYPDPQDFLSLQWKSGVGNNLSHVSMPQVDALLAQANEMSDQAARTPLYQQAEQLLVKQGAAIPLVQTMTIYAVRSRVAGRRIAPTGVTPQSVWQAAYLKR
jgi:ABC-type oligopeptide transport system substrate-binding subunit